MKLWPPPRRVLYTLSTALIIISVILAAALTVSNNAAEHYQSLLSPAVYDRHNTLISLALNAKGQYALEQKVAPNDFLNLLVTKEDRFFYYHPGFNPVSTLRALTSYLTTGYAGGASTITQQLAKNLLGTEEDRTVMNKIRETLYAVGLELVMTKEEILSMYINTAYLGNQVQGFETGSYAYFNKPLSETTLNEQLSLLATLAYPYARNPWEQGNEAYAKGLNDRLTPDNVFVSPNVTNHYAFQSDTAFELRAAGIVCPHRCTTTIDAELTENLRSILNRYITREWERGARNGAIAVIDPNRSELIALIGSRDPGADTGSTEINMAVEPRPIGSTIKPFIYLNGFMAGLRPYTRVDDREYKYPIATGFALYPKNYDGTYHGEVTLHQALSNSLNVPTVKVLEYVGLPNFYSFMRDKLGFTPLRDFDTYQYGIALGGLEMDLLTLTHYFTIFPRAGTLAPLSISAEATLTHTFPPQATITTLRKVADPEYTKLVHAILSDRLSGVEQFGLVSNLNLKIPGYGVKTGTSRDFHDSWVVGYTGDFVVGVWIGNAENEPLKQVSGLSGAGVVWHDTMNILLESSYHLDHEVEIDGLAKFPIGHSLEWGLPGDNVASATELLLDTDLILHPHDTDSFAYSTTTVVPLRASTEVDWYINGTKLKTGTEASFTPDAIGVYEIMAIDTKTGQREILTIRISPLQ